MALIGDLNSTYSTRSTSSDITIAPITPPMTTVASGRCTSAPMPVLNAIGRKPRLATSVVISTGRSRVIAACVTASSSGRPLLPQLADVGDQDHVVEHGHAGQGDEADRRRDRERHVAQPQGEDAADPAERHAGEHAQGVDDVVVGQVQQREDQHRGQRHDDQQPRPGPLQVLELAAELVRSSGPAAA